MRVFILALMATVASTAIAAPANVVNNSLTLADDIHAEIKGRGPCNGVPIQRVDVVEKAELIWLKPELVSGVSCRPNLHAGANGACSINMALTYTSTKTIQVGFNIGFNIAEAFKTLGGGGQFGSAESWAGSFVYASGFNANCVAESCLLQRQVRKLHVEGYRESTTCFKARKTREPYKADYAVKISGVPKGQDELIVYQICSAQDVPCVEGTPICPSG